MPSFIPDSDLPEARTLIEREEFKPFVNLLRVLWIRPELIKAALLVLSRSPRSSEIGSVLELLKWSERPGILTRLWLPFTGTYTFKYEVGEVPTVLTWDLWIERIRLFPVHQALRVVIDFSNAASDPNNEELVVIPPKRRIIYLFQRERGGTRVIRTEGTS